MHLIAASAFLLFPYHFKLSTYWSIQLDEVSFGYKE